MASDILVGIVWLEDSECCCGIVGSMLAVRVRGRVRVGG